MVWEMLQLIDLWIFFILDKFRNNLYKFLFLIGHLLGLLNKNTSIGFIQRVFLIPLWFKILIQFKSRNYFSLAFLAYRWVIYPLEILFKVLNLFSAIRSVSGKVIRIYLYVLTCLLCCCSERLTILTFRLWISPIFLWDILFLRALVLTLRYFWPIIVTSFTTFVNFFLTVNFWITTLLNKFLRLIWNLLKLNF